MENEISFDSFKESDSLSFMPAAPTETTSIAPMSPEEISFDSFAPTEEISFDEFQKPDTTFGSKLNSAVAGALQGVTAGGVDEAIGLGGAALEKLFGVNKSTDYTERVGELQSKVENWLKDAQEANPKTFMAGDITGTMALLGTGIGGAGIKGAAALAAAGGALRTEKKGELNADIATQMGIDAALSAGTAAALGKAGEIAAKSPAGKAVRDAVGAMGEKAKEAFRVADDYTGNIMQRGLEKADEYLQHFNPFPGTGSPGLGRASDAALKAVAPDSAKVVQDGAARRAIDKPAINKTLTKMQQLYQLALKEAAKAEKAGDLTRAQELLNIADVGLKKWNQSVDAVMPNNPGMKNAIKDIQKTFIKGDSRNIKEASKSVFDKAVEGKDSGVVSNLAAWTYLPAEVNILLTPIVNPSTYVKVLDAAGSAYSAAFTSVYKRLGEQGVKDLHQSLLADGAYVEALKKLGGAAASVVDVDSDKYREEFNKFQKSKKDSK